MKIKALLASVAALGLMTVGLSVPAYATGTPAVSLVDTNDTFAGSIVSGYDPATILRLAIISNMGTVTWNNNGSGATLVSNGGYTAQGVWLEGTQDQLTAAMAEVSVQKPCAGSYKIYAEVSDAGLIQDPISGHIFERSPSVSGFNDAIATAQATPLVANGNNTFGYMATVTTSLENIIVSNLLSQDDWLGASDAAVEGDWTWMSGPEAGTVFYRGQGDNGTGVAVNGGFNNWNNGEPNDSGGNEDIGQIYPNGFWNDITDGARTYSIEFGGMPGDNTSQVTVPTDSVDISIAGAFTGAGTQADPYLIPDATALHAVSSCGGPNTYFKQTANITLPSNWVGDQDFQGHYDGDGKTITFSANTPVTHNNFGVWGTAYSSNSSFINMNVSGVLDNSGYNTLGLLYGRGEASVSDSTFSGSINATGSNTWDFGSVSGDSGANITNVTSTVNFTSTDVGGEIGGLVGYFYGTFDHSSWNGTITMNGSGNYVGGLTGDTDCASIYSSHATGTITHNGSGHGIGGLGGYFCGEIRDSFANVDVNAPSSTDVGGFVAEGDGDFYRVGSFGDVHGQDNVGGLFGTLSWNTAEDLYSTGDTTGASNVGSIAGYVRNYEISRAYSMGHVTDASNSSQGPFGTKENTWFDSVNWSPDQTGFGIPMGSIENGETPYSNADQVSIAYYQAANWNISTSWADENTWTICPGFNSGAPFITSFYSTDPCAPDLTNATAPVITGTGVVGKALAMNKGNWDTGVTFTYQWKLDGNNISGATAATYTPVTGDIGKTVTVELTGTKQGFKTAVKLSSNNVVVTAAPIVVVSTEIAVGEFAGNSWWVPLGFVAKVKAAVKAHSKATLLTCTGIVAPGGTKAWQKTLGLKRATLTCAIAKSFNSKLKTKLAWKVSASSDSVKRGAALKFNK